MSPPTVLLVEDSPEFQARLAGVLRTAYGDHAVEVASDCASAHAALRRLPGLRLAIVDLGLPDGEGTSVLRAMSESHPDALRVVATIFDDDAHLFGALAAGANGYLLKDLPTEEWLRCLRQLEAGVPPLSPSIARRVLAHFRAAPPSPLPASAALTAREEEVLRLIGRGLTVVEAAAVLGIAESTVASYIKALYRKLDISSRAEAALEAARRGLT